jgi:hypothetical protein
LRQRFIFEEVKLMIFEASKLMRHLAPLLNRLLYRGGQFLTSCRGRVKTERLRSLMHAFFSLLQPTQNMQLIAEQPNLRLKPVALGGKEPRLRLLS